MKPIASNISPHNRRTSIVLSLLVVMSFASVSAANPKIEKQSFTSNNKKRTFYLFVPELSKPAEPVPLLLVFHGSGRNGLSLVEKWRDLAAREGFIVAGLDAHDSSHWSTTDDNPGVLRDLVETLKSKYAINSRRIYLFGHSAGAVFAIDVAMVESEYFAAAAVHAGSWRERDEFEIMQSARRKTPIAIWVGTKDPFFSVASARATRDALIAKGFPAQVTEMPGHDHWYYDLAPKINEAAWEFLKQYELPTEPRYAEFVEAARAADANKLIAEINLLQGRLMELVKQANLLESQISGKDLTRDAAELQKLAMQEGELLTDASALAKAAAGKAQRAAQMKIGERNSQYLQASSYYQKFGELLDAQREAAEVLLTTDSAKIVVTKRTEAMRKVEQLQSEVNDLRAKVERAMP